MSGFKSELQLKVREYDKNNPTISHEELQLIRKNCIEAAQLGYSFLDRKVPLYISDSPLGNMHNVEDKFKRLIEYLKDRLGIEVWETDHSVEHLPSCRGMDYHTLNKTFRFSWEQNEET